MQRLTARIGFLRTKVARQTLLHFLSAALLPALVSSLLGIWYVRQTLISEASDRVDRTAESATQMLLRDLTTLAKATADLPSLAFTATRESGLSEEELSHLKKGSALLRLPVEAPSRSTSGGEPTTAALRLLRRLPDGRVGERPLADHEIWASLDELIDGDRSELCVFVVRSWQRLHCTTGVTPAREQSLRAVAMSIDAAAARDPTDSSSESLVAHRDLYLRFELASPEWRLIASERRATALAPASSVTTSLAMLIALAAVGAFAFAHRQIRRDTMPLDALHAATRRVAAGDLQTQVIISAGDEYGELATAFNGMTGTLSRQITLLQIMDDVDDATLRERDISAIAAIALDGLRQVRGLERAIVATLDKSSTTAVACAMIETPGTVVHRLAGVFTPAERTAMLAQPRLWEPPVEPSADAKAVVNVHASHSGWLPPAHTASRLVLPLVSDDELLGAIAIDIDPAAATRSEDAKAARRIADRVALGVANVRLLDRLDSLSSGTLLAFARAIDANSQCTAGHSERVTQMALTLGRQLGLAQSELEILYRGGLMHDIGKIGIPSHILDKPGRLTVEERAMIEKHPEIGERILRPIPAFADALSIVRSHHERVDGTGYPDRLKGEDIPWLARILAVADVFDALVSDRPYRAGMSHRASITIIEQSAGTHFDARVVNALLEVQQNNPSALARRGAMQELSMRGASQSNKPHSELAAVA